MTAPPVPFFMFRLFFIAVSIGLIIRFYYALRSAGVSLAARIGVSLVIILFSLTFFLSRMIEGNGFMPKALTFLGTFFSAFLFHALVAWALLGIFRLFNWLFRWIVVTPENRRRWYARCCAGIVGAAFLMCVAGGINSQFLAVREGKIEAPQGIAPLRIVALSDLHLGRLASVDYLADIVARIEPLSPDIVFFVGDILEYNVDHSEADALAAVLQRLKPRLGLWGVMGNHEYMGNKPELNRQLLNRMGIHMLIDQWAELEITHEGNPSGKILLIGRDDRRERTLSIQDVIADAPADALKILLDHQPFGLEEAEEAGVFLQLSGHTHNGQFFPLNFIVSNIFENAHGYSRRGETHYWVTSGVGTWGARIRTSGRPEIVLIDLIPEEETLSR
ncbi:MAG: metallophosphoesterase [Zoogloeaceae bacterium]|jgi:predicted MPP superfamily phosphohydrolase|nr:metallophosphoesterase [Zoogloeaceae bacterium]